MQQKGDADLQTSVSSLAVISACEEMKYLKNKSDLVYEGEQHD